MNVRTKKDYSIVIVFDTNLYPYTVLIELSAKTVSNKLCKIFISTYSKKVLRIIL